MCECRARATLAPPSVQLKAFGLLRPNRFTADSSGTHSSSVESKTGRCQPLETKAKSTFICRIRCSSRWPSTGGLGGPFWSMSTPLQFLHLQGEFCNYGHQSGQEQTSAVNFERYVVALDIELRYRVRRWSKCALHCTVLAPIHDSPRGSVGLLDRNQRYCFQSFSTQYMNGLAGGR